MASNSADNWSMDEWFADCYVPRNEMNQLIMDYLITEGYKEAAEKFAEEAGLKDESAMEKSLENRIRVKMAIQDGRITDAIAMINDIHPELLDGNRYLHFHLLQQQLIEIIRAGATEEALIFAQENLAEKGENNPQVLTELERTLALLAFEKPEESPFAELLNLNQRTRVANEVNSALLMASHKCSTSRLHVLVQLVMWSQEQLDKKQISYPKLTDLANCSMEPPKPKLL